MIKKVLFLICFSVFVCAFFVCCADENIEKHPDTLEGQRIHNSNVYWGIDDDALYIWPVNGVSGKLPNRWGNNPYWPWQTRSDFSRVIIEDGVQPDWDISYMFCAFNADNRINYIRFPDNFDTSNVEYFDHMFMGCSGVRSLNVSSWNTSKVSAMTYMFAGCYNLEALDLSSWDVSSVYSVCGMFYNCSKLVSLDLSTWPLSRCSFFNEMFKGCTSLEELDLCLLNTNNATDMEDMFKNCSSLVKICLGPNFVFNGRNIALRADWALLSGSYWRKDDSDEYVSSEWLRDNYDGSTMSGTYFGYQALAVLYENGDFVFQWNDDFDSSKGNVLAVYRGVEDQDAFTYSGSCPWNRNRQLVKHVEFKDIICPKNMSYWFYDMSNLTSIDFGLLDLSRVSSMYSLFNRCSRLKTLDLSSFSTSTVTNIGYMFANTDIESIVLPDTFVTTNVTNMSYLFYYCSKLGEVVLPSNFVIKSGVDVRNMFNGCSSLKSIVLSDGFRFSTSSYYNCVLPTPR